MNQLVMRYSKLLLVLMAFFAPFIVTAQITTTSVTGTVKGDGKGLQGVAVVAIYTPTGAQYYTTTDERGFYSISDVIPGGPYTVIFSVIGYKTLSISEVYPQLSNSIILNADLNYDLDQTPGKIERKRWNNLASNLLGWGSSLTFGEDHFAAVPTSTGDISDLFALSPKVHTRGDIFAIGGADNLTSLEAFTRSVGVGPYLGSVNELLHLEVVDQITLAAAAYDVRQRLFMGAAVNTSLKRGSNEFTAAAYSEFREDNNYGATASGPIIRDKLFFFANLEGTKNSSITFGRLDWNITSDHQLQARYHRSAQYPGLSTSTFATELNSRFLDGKLTNVARASYSLQKEYLEGSFCFVSDDLTYNLGRHSLLAGLQVEHSYDQWLSLYFQDNYHVGERLLLNGGVRVDKILGSKHLYLSPRVGFNLDVLGKRWLVLRGGTAVFSHKEYDIWKSSLSFDITLPWSITSTLEGIYAMDLNNKNIYYYSASARFDKQLSRGFGAMATYSYNGAKDIEGYSGCVMTHKVVAALQYRKEYAKHFATMVSLQYSGGPKERASLYYVPKPDGEYEPLDIPLSKFSIDFEDYFYTDAAGQEQVYLAKNQQDDFRELITSNKYLSKSVGKVAEPNGLQSPWENRIDLKIAQEFFIVLGGKTHNLQIGLDIVNIANLLNPKWGKYYTLNTNFLLKKLPQANGNTLYHFPLLNGERITSLWNNGLTTGRTYSFQVSLRYGF